MAFWERGDVLFYDFFLLSSLGSPLFSLLSTSFFLLFCFGWIVEMLFHDSPSLSGTATGFRFV